MGIDLARCNKRFKELIEKVRKNKENNLTNKDEILLYLFFLEGYKAGSQMEQEIA